MQKQTPLRWIQQAGLAVQQYEQNCSKNMCCTINSENNADMITMFYNTVIVHTCGEHPNHIIMNPKEKHTTELPEYDWAVDKPQLRDAPYLFVFFTFFARNIAVSRRGVFPVLTCRLNEVFSLIKMQSWFFSQTLGACACCVAW